MKPKGKLDWAVQLGPLIQLARQDDELRNKFFLEKKKKRQEVARYIKGRNKATE